MKIRHAFVCAILAYSPLMSAFGAGLEGPYIAIGGGQSQLSAGGGEFRETSIAYKGLVGYALGDYLAIEAAYFKADDHTANFDSLQLTGALNGLNGSILLRAPKGGSFAFYLKAGYAMYDYELRTNVAGGSVGVGKGSESDISFGWGVNFVLRNGLMLRLEAEGIQIGEIEFTTPVPGLGSFQVGDVDFNFAMISVGYKF